MPQWNYMPKPSQPVEREESGFYKYENEKLSHAPNFVWHKDYELKREDKDIYRFPSFGWHWFETRQEALDFFKIEEDMKIDLNRTYTGEEVKALIDKAIADTEKKFSDGRE